MNDLSAIIRAVGNQEAAADFDRQRFRWRLDWVIQIKAGNVAAFARRLAAVGAPITDGGVRKWRKGDDETWIGGKYLWAIRRACDDISIDWLLGLAEARKDTTEAYIDGEIARGNIAPLDEP